MSGLRRMFAWCVIGVVWMTGSAWSDATDAPAIGVDRVACQEKIEEVYWTHRSWPDVNPGPKPPLGSVMSRVEILGKIDQADRAEAVLAVRWNERLTAPDLQQELDRMVRESRAPGMLNEILDALDRDPELIAECLVRPRLAQRRAQQLFARDPRIHGALRESAEAAVRWRHDTRKLIEAGAEVHHGTWILSDGQRESDQAGILFVDQSAWADLVVGLADLAQPNPGNPSRTVGEALSALTRRAGEGFSGVTEEDDRFVAIAVDGVAEGSVSVSTAVWKKESWDHWIERQSVAPVSADRPAVALRVPKTDRAEPCLDDTWSAPTTVGAPTARHFMASVWTGAEMVVWGGNSFGFAPLGTGGLYDPATDSWTSTSMVNAPNGRYFIGWVWTGTEMIVWGGYPLTNTGGRYNPATDTWSATSTVQAPTPRFSEFPVWTGSEMILWGGYDFSVDLDDGARYDPVADSWTPMESTGALSARRGHSTAWTGSKMILWSGYSNGYLSDGALYDPVTDSWSAMNTSGAPTPRGRSVRAWTGSTMVVWGGGDGEYFNTGGIYDPAMDSWAATSTTGAPAGRDNFGGVWTGRELLVWGGFSGDEVNTGGRYDPASDSWSAMTGTDAPGARSHLAAVWTGDHMIVWGGRVNPSNGTSVNTGGLYCAAGYLGTDFGDAPDPSFPTLVASDGARHQLYGELYLGATADPESDGQPEASAAGDDGDGTDDEDGITLPSAMPAGGTADVTVVASAPGLLNAWIDFDRDGAWTGPGEQVWTDVPVVAGSNQLSIQAPLSLSAGEAMARFRLNSSGGLSPTGLATDGEVEDHTVILETTAELEVSVQVAPLMVVEGGTVSYTVTVSNNGLMGATDVVLTDTLPPEVGFSSVLPEPPTCSEASGVVTCDLGSVESGGSTAVTIVADVPLGFVGGISNTASVTLAEVDPISANNTLNTVTTVFAVDVFHDDFEIGTTANWSAASP
jgi:uncharacterized repeat protein (TIGR01451 family)